jgi:hypothetical protein
MMPDPASRLLVVVQSDSTRSARWKHEPQEVQSDYYSAVAQAIPVLFVLIAAEYHFADLGEWTRTLYGGGPPDEPGYSHPVRAIYVASACFFGIVLTALMGEFAALRALVTDQASSFTADFLIIATLVCAAGQILAIPLVASRRRVLDARTQMSQSFTPADDLIFGCAFLIALGTATLVPIAQVVVLAVHVV